MSAPRPPRDGSDFELWYLRGVENGRQLGRAEERGAIVAWLRSWMGDGAELLKELSADIERGAHEPMRPVESNAMVETAVAFHRHNYGEGRCDVAGCKVCGGPVRPIEPTKQCSLWASSIGPRCTREVDHGGKHSFEIEPTMVIEPGEK